jgi:hypothetical protein
MSNPLLLNAVQESQLFTTSAASDVQVSKGYLKIGEMSRTKLSLISDFIQVKYRAETVQVVTITTSSITPAGNTYYTIEFGDTNRSRGGIQEALMRVSYLTPADITTLGATAALQREAINLALVAKINAYTSSYFVTAASSTGGAGLTITDSAGYYPVNAQGMTIRLGATYVKTCSNSDGTGFVGTEASITTAAVYSFGVGADLAAWKPVIDQMWGNLISGYLGGTAPKTSSGAYATSGQKYDSFAVVALAETPIATSVRTQTAYMPKIQIAYVDNGTGSDVTNLAGFKAIERVFHKQIVYQYKNDPSTTQQWFDAPLVMQDPLGAAPTGTANTLGWLGDGRFGLLNKTNIGTATVVSPVLNADGLLLDQDNSASEGAHYSANQQALGDQSFIVGKTAFSVARVQAGDWTDAQFLVGFRKKAVYTADYNDYTDLGAIGGGAADGDSITTQGILNNAATVATDSGVNFVDAVSMLLRIDVAINGTVSAYYASASGGWVSTPIYSTGTTTLIFDAGDEMIPFFQFVNIGGGDPDLVIAEFFAISTTEAFPLN